MHMDLDYNVAAKVRSESSLPKTDNLARYSTDKNSYAQIWVFLPCILPLFLGMQCTSIAYLPTYLSKC